MSSQTLEQRFIYIPKSALIASLCLHGALLVGFLGAKVLDHFGIHLFHHPYISKEMYQNFIQVDVVALPDQLVNQKGLVDMSQPIVDKPKMETVPQPVPPNPALDKDLMKTEDKANPKEDLLAKQREAERLKEKQKTKEKQKEQEKEKANKLARDKALKQIQEEARREQAMKGLEAKAGKRGRSKISGNILSQGTGLTGAIGTPKDRYTALLGEAIRQHYNVYYWHKKGLRTEVYLDILSNGRLKDKKIVKPSTDPTYDSAVLQAIEEAQPLPIPDDPSILNDGIDITFTP